MPGIEIPVWEAFSRASVGRLSIGRSMFSPCKYLKLRCTRPTDARLKASQTGISMPGSDAQPPNHMEEIEQMWQQFAAMKFPRGCGGREVAGVCLVSMDSFAAGCVSTFIAWKGRLDASRIEDLQKCVGGLETAVPLLDHPERAYFEFLLAMSRKTLQHVT